MQHGAIGGNYEHQQRFRQQIQAQQTSGYGPGPLQQQAQQQGQQGERGGNIGNGGLLLPSISSSLGSYQQPGVYGQGQPQQQTVMGHQGGFGLGQQSAAYQQQQHVQAQYQPSPQHHQHTSQSQYSPPASSFQASSPFSPQTQQPSQHTQSLLEQNPLAFIAAAGLMEIQNGGASAGPSPASSPKAPANAPTATAGPTHEKPYAAHAMSVTAVVSGGTTGTAAMAVQTNTQDLWKSHDSVHAPENTDRSQQHSQQPLTIKSSLTLSIPPEMPSLSAAVSSAGSAAQTPGTSTPVNIPPSLQLRPPITLSTPTNLYSTPGSSSGTPLAFGMGGPTVTAISSTPSQTQTPSEPSKTPASTEEQRAIRREYERFQRKRARAARVTKLLTTLVVTLKVSPENLRAHSASQGWPTENRWFGKSHRDSIEDVRAQLARTNETVDELLELYNADREGRVVGVSLARKMKAKEGKVDLRASVGGEVAEGAEGVEGSGTVHKASVGLPGSQPRTPAGASPKNVLPPPRQGKRREFTRAAAKKAEEAIHTSILDIEEAYSSLESESEPEAHNSLTKPSETPALQPQESEFRTMREIAFEKSQLRLNNEKAIKEAMARREELRKIRMEEERKAKAEAERLRLIREEEERKLAAIREEEERRLREIREREEARLRAIREEEERRLAAIRAEIRRKEEEEARRRREIEEREEAIRLAYEEGKKAARLAYKSGGVISDDSDAEVVEQTNPSPPASPKEPPARKGSKYDFFSSEADYPEPEAQMDYAPPAQDFSDYDDHDFGGFQMMDVDSPSPAPEAQEEEAVSPRGASIAPQEEEPEKPKRRPGRPRKDTRKLRGAVKAAKEAKQAKETRLKNVVTVWVPTVVPPLLSEVDKRAYRIFNAKFQESAWSDLPVVRESPMPVRTTRGRERKVVPVVPNSQPSFYQTPQAAQASPPRSTRSGRIAAPAAPPAASPPRSTRSGRTARLSNAFQDTPAAQPHAFSRPTPVTRQPSATNKDAFRTSSPPPPAEFEHSTPPPPTSKPTGKRTRRSSPPITVYVPETQDPTSSPLPRSVPRFVPKPSQHAFSQPHPPSQSRQRQNQTIQPIALDLDFSTFLDGADEDDDGDLSQVVRSGKEQLMDLTRKSEEFLTSFHTPQTASAFNPNAGLGTSAVFGAAPTMGMGMQAGGATGNGWMEGVYSEGFVEIYIPTDSEAEDQEPALSTFRAKTILPGSSSSSLRKKRRRLNGHDTEEEESEDEEDEFVPYRERSRSGAGRPRGRPRKSEGGGGTQEGGEGEVKRGRGRPRKYPRPEERGEPETITIDG